MTYAVGGPLPPHEDDGLLVHLDSGYVIPRSQLERLNVSPGVQVRLEEWCPT